MESWESWQNVPAEIRRRMRLVIVTGDDAHVECHHYDNNGAWLVLWDVLVVPHFHASSIVGGAGILSLPFLVLWGGACRQIYPLPGVTAPDA